MKTAADMRQDEEARWAERRARMDMLLDETHAVMDRATFDALMEYSASIPTGVFRGKVWKAHRQPKGFTDPGTWWLGEYVDDPASDEYVLIIWREILVVE